jgi:hypothetical protein
MKSTLAERKYSLGNGCGKLIIVTILGLCKKNDRLWGKVGSLVCSASFRGPHPTWRSSRRLELHIVRSYIRGVLNNFIRFIPHTIIHNP